MLTGTNVDGVVVFGNDYLLTFDADNNLMRKKQLHKNIIPATYGKSGGQDIAGAAHTHAPETGDLISATDICTIMLNEGIAKWNEYYVYSKNYVSIWNCETDHLSILTIEGAKHYFKQKDKLRKKRKKNN